MENYFKKTKETVQSQLQQSKYIALSTDGWSSKPNDNYLTVTAHFIGEDAELKSYMLECAQFSDRHTAENLANLVKQIAEEWNISNKIVAVSSDNASNIKGAIKHNNWKQIPCFAHTLNLVVQNALLKIKDTQIKTKNIVELFKRSPLACERLRTMQENLGEPMLKVKQDIVTRWNSTYDMFQRVLEIRNSLLSTLAIDYSATSTLNNEDIEVITAATELLSVFKDVTEEMSSERKVTVSEVIWLMDLFIFESSYCLICKTK